MVAYKKDAEKMIRLNLAKGYIIKHVIEPQEQGAGLVEIQGAGAGAENQKLYSYDIIWNGEESVAQGRNLAELKANSLELFDGLKEAGDFTLTLDIGDKKLKLVSQVVFDNVQGKYPYNDSHKLIVNLNAK